MSTIVLAGVFAGNFSRQSWKQLPKISGCVLVHHRDYSDKVPIKLSAMKRGTGGRSSFSGIVATVFGATGYLGKHVCNKLGKIGSQVIIPYRCEEYSVLPLKLVGDLGQVLFFPFDLRDEESIRKSVQYSNVVINLVGQFWETKNFTFRDVHVEGARRIARIAREAGVEKFIHVSHLNAKEHPQIIWKESEFLKSKYASELAVREEFPGAIIVKPSDMFGDSDRFLMYFNLRSRWSLLPHGIPLWKKGEHTIKQPVYVSDVAEGIVRAIRNPDVVGKNIECVGPQRYYLADIVDYIIQILRRSDSMRRTGLTRFLRLKAKLIEMRPTEPTFNMEKLELEGITDWTNADNPSLEDLGVPLTQFPPIAQFVLKNYALFNYYSETFGEFAEPTPPKPAEFYQPKEDKKSLVY